MAASWAELVKRLQERQESGKALTAAVLWREFKRQAAQSNRQDVRHLAEIGKGMTPEDRGRFAVAVMPLLVTLDWPLAWEAARPGLIVALEAILEETDSEHPNRFAHAYLSAVPSPEHEAKLFDTAWISLDVALDMLRRPCPASELRNVAALCVLGTSQPALLAFEFSKSDNDFASEPLMHACSQYLQAFERYVRAARAMNQAVGAVIFDGLDLGAAEAP
ncbi:hypothetical protein [Polyangium fumosum]|uniref:Uncharacterized protein n=1 Tax=Polyangium fumosum TaxID=889272 RepID=A0A4U1J3F5_9BACT|nr:hypothetical protein [Polyangium fumosum]TKD01696.1 hypothetical protein E8A74_30595 [Polyangium fumosum]